MAGLMRQEMADFAHALVREADLRSPSFRPMIDGPLAFAGRNWGGRDAGVYR